MTVSFPQPSLEMYRPVTNFPDELYQDVRHAIGNNLGVSLGRFAINKQLKAHIFTSGQILHLYNFLGVELTRPSLDKLADHLSDNMPDSVDETIKVDSFPTEVHKYKHTARSSDIALASINPTVIAERRAYERLAYAHLDPDHEQDFEKILAKPQDHVTQVHYIRSTDKALLGEINDFLQGSSLLPDTLELGPAVIDDVTKTVILH